MTIAPFIVVAVLFGAVALVAGRRSGLAAFAGGGGLAVVVLMAILLPVEGASTSLAGEPIVVDGYVRLFLILASLSGLLLLLTVATAPHDRTESASPGLDHLIGAGFLLFAGSAAVALAVAAPLPALGAATLAGFGLLLVAARAGVAVSETEPSDRLHGASRPLSARTLPTRLGTEAVRGGAALVVATAALALLIGRGDVVAGEPFGVGAAALTIAGAVALRLGIAPLHVHMARLAEAPIRGLVALLCVWSPAVFALAALAGTQAAVVPLGLPLGLERGLIAGVAILTIVLGGLAAFVQDDLEHVVAYSILQDIAVAFFAFAALDSAGWGPARTWLLLVPLAKTALLAWTIVAVRTFGSRSLIDLRGWARSAPILAVAFAVVVAASVGLPGFASFQARLDLVGVALADPVRSLVVLLSLTTAVVLGRVLVIGLLEPTALVRAAHDERLRRPAPDLRRRVSETARQTVDLNRAPLAAAFAAALALVAFSASAGLFDLERAAAEHVPSPLPGAQPSTGPIETFRPIPTESPGPEASPSVAASPSPAPSRIPSPAASPRATPRPTSS